MMKDEIFPAKEGYDLVAEYYRDAKWQHLWSQVERPFVVNWLKDIKKGSGIDIGSGNGPYVNDMVKIGHSVVALDISSRMIAENKKNHRNCPKVSFVVDDIEHYNKIANRTFDWALCTRVLSNISKFESTIEIMANLVKVDGEILITDIHPEHTYNNTGFEIPRGTAKLATTKVKIETYKHPISLLQSELDKYGFRGIYLKILRFEDVEKHIDKTKFKKLYSTSKNGLLYILRAVKIN